MTAKWAGHSGVLLKPCRAESPRSSGFLFTFLTGLPNGPGLSLAWPYAESCQRNRGVIPSIGFLLSSQVSNDSVMPHARACMRALGKQGRRPGHRMRRAGNAESEAPRWSAATDQRARGCKAGLSGNSRYNIRMIWHMTAGVLPPHVTAGAPPRGIRRI